MTTACFVFTNSAFKIFKKISIRNTTNTVLIFYTMLFHSIQVIIHYNTASLAIGLGPPKIIFLTYGQTIP